MYQWQLQHLECPGTKTLQGLPMVYGPCALESVAAPNNCLIIISMVLGLLAAVGEQKQPEALTAPEVGQA